MRFKNHKLPIERSSDQILVLTRELALLLNEIALLAFWVPSLPANDDWSSVSLIFLPTME